MPAHNNSFPWMSYYKNYQFFENLMLKHSKVLAIRNTGDGLYEIDLKDDRTITLFICECYSYGVAEYQESIEKLGSLNVVIINSNWCGYSMDVKFHCQELGVGVFNIKGFMAALNQSDFWNYLTKEEKRYINRGA